jgi:hypothetical protein
VNIVRVWEPHSPPGAEPIEWLLLTSEPITCPKELLQTVDWYRARWTIEEYFKALKTGCRYEARQLENRSSLLAALGLFVPIAWQMLALRAEARSPEGSASTSKTVTPLQLKILRRFVPKKLGTHPTSRDIYLTIAALGGHITNNGEPGWLVLARGFKKLVDYEMVWLVAVGGGTKK